VWREFNSGARPGYYIWRGGGLRPGHGAPAGMPPVESQEAKPPEAESSVAFEAPAEEPN